MIPKKCKYCKHREVHKSRFETFGDIEIRVSSLCMHKKSVYWCRISGGNVVMSTQLMREKGKPCGPDAILWEMKEYEVKKV